MHQFVDFENKKKFFKLELEHIQLGSYPRTSLKIRREDIFMNSFDIISALTVSELRGKFTIEFVNEEGVDAGGILREWFLLLSKEIFNANYCLFKPSSTGNTYQPNSQSGINVNHLKYFKFIGQIIGKVLV